jgi:hypothetical protein
LNGWHSIKIVLGDGHLISASIIYPAMKQQLIARMAMPLYEFDCKRTLQMLLGGYL